MSNPLPLKKVISSLPENLEANTLYFVRTGYGFSIFLTDMTGRFAHRLNAPPQGEIHAAFPDATDTSNQYQSVYDPSYLLLACPAKKVELSGFVTVENSVENPEIELSLYQGETALQTFYLYCPQNRKVSFTLPTFFLNLSESTEFNLLVSSGATLFNSSYLRAIPIR